MTDLELLDRCIEIIDSQWAGAEVRAKAEETAARIIEELHPPRAPEED